MRKYAIPRNSVPGLFTPSAENPKAPELFEPIKISKSCTVKNRIGVAPMCMYSSIDGHVSPFHSVHVPSFALYGAGMIIMEATAVTPDGRITARDAGLWSDEHIDGLKSICDLVKSTGTVIGIQLAHAGRKGSTYPPFVGEGHSAVVPVGQSDDSVERGKEVYGQQVLDVCRGYPVVGPSDLAYSSKLGKPHKMSIPEIQSTITAFADAAVRADKAGFDLVEVHAAHGYLIHQFLSPLSNDRTDEYGSSFENRARFCVETCEAVKRVWPSDKAISIRLSCTDFVEGGWDLDQTIDLVKLLVSKRLVDIVHCSAGGLSPLQKFPPLVPGYQVPFVTAVKKAVPETIVATVGQISDPVHANQILKDGSADIIMMAREFIRNPAWPLQAAAKLGVSKELSRMPQYNRSREHPR